MQMGILILSKLPPYSSFFRSISLQFDKFLLLGAKFFVFDFVLKGKKSYRLLFDLDLKFCV